MTTLDMPLKMLDITKCPPPAQASDYLIFPWLQPGRLTLMVGATESGKTTLTAEMIAACARGGLLWGRYPCKKISKVLYLHTEHSIESVADIVHKRKDIPEDLMYVIHDFGGYGSAMIQDQRPNLTLLSSIAKCADKIKPELIIAEPITGFLSSSENDNKEARLLIQILTSLASRYKAALLTHHHFSKAVFDPERQRPVGIPTGEARGAMAFEDAAERIIYLKRDDQHTKVEPPKPKGYPVSPVHITRDEDTCKYSLFTDVPGPDVIGLCAMIRSAGAHCHKTVLVPKCISTWKCSPSHVETLYNRAVTLGLVSPDGRLTEAK